MLSPELRADRKRRRYVPAKLKQKLAAELAEGRACTYCGDKAAVWDHIIAIARGGDSRESNLTPACRPCNDAKNIMTVEEWKRARMEIFGLPWPPNTERDREVRAALEDRAIKEGGRIPWIWSRYFIEKRILWSAEVNGHLETEYEEDSEAPRNEESPNHTETRSGVH